MSSVSVSVSVSRKAPRADPLPGIVRKSTGYIPVNVTSRPSPYKSDEHGWVSVPSIRIQKVRVRRTQEYRNLCRAQYVIGDNFVDTQLAI